MANVIINKETCIGCGLCVKDCSRKAIVLVNDKALVDLDLCNECGHCLAICPENSFSMPQYDNNEIIEVDEDRLKLDPDDFLYFQKCRRSIRQFKNKDIEIDKLNKIIEAGRYSPTASNRQMNRYIVIRDKIDEGLGVCDIGFLGRAVKFDNKIKELIGMKDDEEFILSFVLGYPNVKYKRSVNRMPSDVRII
jgi:NAD-dependent dihydropyrimidine dehydrogenase PreA subunit